MGKDGGKAWSLCSRRDLDLLAVRMHLGFMTWIACKDRMPAEGEYVSQLWTKWGSLCGGPQWNEKSGHWKTPCADSEITPDIFTHWMGFNLERPN